MTIKYLTVCYVACLLHVGGEVHVPVSHCLDCSHGEETVNQEKPHRGLATIARLTAPPGQATQHMEGKRRLDFTD